MIKVWYVLECDNCACNYGEQIIEVCNRPSSKVRAYLLRTAQSQGWIVKKNKTYCCKDCEKQDMGE